MTFDADLTAGITDAITQMATAGVQYYTGSAWASITAVWSENMPSGFITDDQRGSDVDDRSATVRFLPSATIAIGTKLKAPDGAEFSVTGVRSMRGQKIAQAVSRTVISSQGNRGSAA